MTTITIGRSLVPLEHVALIEHFDRAANPRLQTERPFQSRVVLTSRESILTEEPWQAFAEAHGFRMLPVPERIASAERFAANTHAEICHGGNMAYYAIGADRVQMPPYESFRDAESYYGTLLHELTHWTRHPKRLDREFGRKRWGDAGYAAEELVAELGAAFLCADLGVTAEPRADHASYLANWLTVLKNDKRAIFTAAAHAQKAADFLHGLQAPALEPVRPSANATASASMSTVLAPTS